MCNTNFPYPKTIFLWLVFSGSTKTGKCVPKKIVVNLRKMPMGTFDSQDRPMQWNNHSHPRGKECNFFEETH